MVRQLEAGDSVRRVAAMFAVSPSFVVKLTLAWRRRGTVVALPQGGDQRSAAIEQHRDWLLQLVAETPDLTLAKIRERLGARGLFRRPAREQRRLRVDRGDFGGSVIVGFWHFCDTPRQIKDGRFRPGRGSSRAATIPNLWAHGLK